jgi:thiosulfate/3-mercaptopyruvate sulfurtransferase
LEEYRRNGPSNIKFIDATWFHKGIRDGRKEFLQGPRLPGGAQYFDVADLSCSYELFPTDNPKNLFAMYPPPTLMAAAFDYMGITPQTTIIIYGREGTLFTPRAWYMFQKYCVPSQQVVLMQGSLEEWIRLGGPVDETILQDGIDLCTAKDLMKSANNTISYPVSSSAREQIVDMEHILKLLELEESSRP